MKVYPMLIYLDKIQTLQDFHSGKIKVGKMDLSYFHELQFITISFLIRDSYFNWSKGLSLLKAC